jgi:hypothetical protein
MDNKDKKDEWQWPEYKDVVFVPDELAFAANRAYIKMWQARQEFQKVAEKMEELKITD